MILSRLRSSCDAVGPFSVRHCALAAAMERRNRRAAIFRSTFFLNTIKFSWSTYDFSNRIKVPLHLRKTSDTMTANTNHEMCIALHATACFFSVLLAPVWLSTNFRLFEDKAFQNRIPGRWPYSQSPTIWKHFPRSAKPTPSCKFLKCLNFVNWLNFERWKIVMNTFKRL